MPMRVEGELDGVEEEAISLRFTRMRNGKPSGLIT
jgi:hypothetical protein